MQNNTISVDGVNYERFQEYPDRSIYTADGHTIANPHVLTLGRVVPASNDASIKTRVKHSLTVTKSDGTKGTIILETNVSYPQWAGISNVSSELANHQKFLATPEMTKLVTTQSI